MLIFYSDCGGLAGHYCCRLMSGKRRNISPSRPGELLCWPGSHFTCYSMYYPHDRENLVRTIAGILSVCQVQPIDIFLIDCNILLPRWLSVLSRLAPNAGHVRAMHILENSPRLVTNLIDQCLRLL